MLIYAVCLHRVVRYVIITYYGVFVNAIFAKAVEKRSLKADFFHPSEKKEIFAVVWRGNVFVL